MIKEVSIKAVFGKSLKLKHHESCLVVTDTVKESIACPFFEYASGICSQCHIEIMEPLREHGQEPPDRIRQAMLEYDVQLLITNKSLSHTKARRDAKKQGARIASMPTITEDIANRCLDVDYEEVKRISLHVHHYLAKAERVRITTERGTDITLERGDREVLHGNGGIFDYASAFGNLPEGEVSFGPVTAHGVYIVDASFATLGELTSPLSFTVHKGMVTNIDGKRAAELKKDLDTIGPNAYKIAELGIGTNPKAQIVGVVLEDEKVLGTCHIGLGNDMSYGGTNNVPVHLDGVIMKPTIFVDDEKIMEKGVPLNWS